MWPADSLSEYRSERGQIVIRTLHSEQKGQRDFCHVIHMFSVISSKGLMQTFPNRGLALLKWWDTQSVGKEYPFLYASPANFFLSMIALFLIFCYWSTILFRYVKSSVFLWPRSLVVYFHILLQSLNVLP